jgi:hypothetical protein
MGAVWPPLLAVLPFLAVAVAAPLAQALVAARRALDARAELQGGRRRRLDALTTFLHLLQPAARLYGRFCRGLTPWRRRGVQGFALPLPRIVTSWTESWSPPEDRLSGLEGRLRQRGAVVLSGGDFDRWDCEVRGGVFGATRVRLLVEEHGQGRQLARFRVWPRCSPRVVAPLALSAAIAALAAADGVAGPFLLLTAATALRTLYECAAAMATVLAALAPRQVPLPAAEPSPTPAPDDVDELELAGGAGDQ